MSNLENINNIKTPEQIVGMIGNIANRQDIIKVQEEQIKEINKLVDVYKKACEDILWLCGAYIDFDENNTFYDDIDEDLNRAESYIKNIEKRLTNIK